MPHHTPHPQSSSSYRQAAHPPYHYARNGSHLSYPGSHQQQSSHYHYECHPHHSNYPYPPHPDHRQSSRRSDYYPPYPYYYHAPHPYEHSSRGAYSSHPRDSPTQDKSRDKEPDERRTESPPRPAHVSKALSAPASQDYRDTTTRDPELKKPDTRCPVSALLMAAASTEAAAPSDDKKIDALAKMAVKAEHHGEPMQMDRRSPDNETGHDDSDDTGRADSQPITSASRAAKSPSPSLSNSAGPLKKRMKIEGMLPNEPGAAGTESQSREGEDAASAEPVESRPQPDNPKPRQEYEPMEKPATPSLDHSSGIVILRHLPKVLHQLLTSPSDLHVESAMEWLPSGEGWRVLRWDVMSSLVLPNKFPELCDDIVGMKEESAEERQVRGGVKRERPDSEKAKFTDDQWVEAFLWHVKAWGFKEVRTGKDKGTFHHRFFLRDSPELCNKMGQDPSATSPSVISEIGRSTSSLDGMAWRTSRKVASTIFKPRTSNEKEMRPRQETDEYYRPSHSSHDRRDPHPSFLNVPALTSTNTASFAENWAGSRRHHPYSHPIDSAPSSDMHYSRHFPHRTISSKAESAELTRSPRIRFREHDEQHSYHRFPHEDNIPQSAAEISPTEHSHPTAEVEYRRGEHSRGPLSSTIQDDAAVHISPCPEEPHAHSSSPPVKTAYDHSRKIHFSSSFGKVEKNIHFSEVPHSGSSSFSNTHKHVPFPVSRRGGRGGLRPATVARRTTD